MIMREFFLLVTFCLVSNLAGAGDRQALSGTIDSTTSGVVADHYLVNILTHGTSFRRGDPISVVAVSKRAFTNGHTSFPAGSKIEIMGSSLIPLDPNSRHPEYRKILISTLSLFGMALVNPNSLIRIYKFNGPAKDITIIKN